MCNPMGYVLRNLSWRLHMYSGKGLPMSWLIESTVPAYICISKQVATAIAKLLKSHICIDEENSIHNAKGQKLPLQDVLYAYAVKL